MPESYWEQRTSETREALKRLGVEASEGTAKLIAEIRDLSAGPQLEAKAKLDLLLQDENQKRVREITDAAWELVKSSERGTGIMQQRLVQLTDATLKLVESSDSSTTTMARLAGQLNRLTFAYVCLTCVLVVLGSVQFWLALRATPAPIIVPAPVVNVPAPVLHIEPAPSSPRPSPVRRRGLS